MVYVLSESFMHLPLRPIFRQSHPNFINVRLKNLGTTDKKSSHKIKYKKIPRVHQNMLPESAGAPTSSLYLRVQLTVMIQTSRKGR